jgi:hypothetical protein
VYQTQQVLFLSGEINTLRPLLREKGVYQLPEGTRRKEREKIEVPLLKNPQHEQKNQKRREGGCLSLSFSPFSQKISPERRF